MDGLHCTLQLCLTIFATAEVLLRRETSVEAQCNNALRPLHYAAMSAQSADLVQLLLGHGASTETECGGGRRPIHYVSSTGNTMVLWTCYCGAELQSMLAMDPVIVHCK